MNPLEYFICGGFGGVCTVLVGHPLDTVKVRLQTMSVKPGEKPMYSGTWDCLTKTVKHEGFRGLYKGMAAPLAGVSPIFAISFFGYGVGKKLFNVDNSSQHKTLRTFAAGAFSGIFTTIIMSPGERIKCLLQIQQGSATKVYDGPVDVVKKLYKEGGIKSVYRGSVATLCRDVPASGLYFLTYQSMTTMLSKPGEAPSMPVTILAGGMSGIANWVVGMPADVLKSRLQTAPEGTYPGGMKQVFSELLRKEGIGALYKGFTPVILRAFPANAACFVGFELAASVLRKSYQSTKPTSTT